jgi:hypothetical protein
MVDEAANGFGPTSEVRDILADCFEPEVSGECTLTRGGRCLKGGNICSLRQGFSQNSLDVVGKAKNFGFHGVGAPRLVCGPPYWIVGKGGQYGLAHGFSQCDGPEGVNRHF